MQRLYYPNGDRRVAYKLPCLLSMLLISLHSAAAAPTLPDTHRDMPAVKRQPLSDVLAEQHHRLQTRNHHSDFHTDTEDSGQPTAPHFIYPDNSNYSAPVHADPKPSSEDQLRTHLAIGFGTVAGVLALLLLLYLLYRFRRRLFPRRFPPPRQSSPGFGQLPEKPPQSLYSPESFAAGSVPSLPPARPQPALVPPKPRNERQSFRASLLSKTRFPIAPAAPQSPPLQPNDDRDARTYFPELFDAQTGRVASSRPGSLFGRMSRASTAPIPESPEAAHRASRFSWTGRPGTAGRPGTSGSWSAVRPGSARGSVMTLESAPRFKAVNSWVNTQAGRVGVGVGMGHARAPSVPPTPKELAMHPGAEVKFVGSHGRMESRELDMRLEMPETRELDMMAGIREGV